MFYYTYLLKNLVITRIIQKWKITARHDRNLKSHPYNIFYIIYFTPPLYTPKEISITTGDIVICKINKYILYFFGVIISEEIQNDTNRYHISCDTTIVADYRCYLITLMSRRKRRKYTTSTESILIYIHSPTIPTCFATPIF